MPTITLPDGRDLEVEVTGPDGGPVIALPPRHSRWHRSSSAGSPTGACARTPARHLVAGRVRRVDPASRTRRSSSETADAASVLDHVDVESCVVAGWSGGGPHALACAALAAGPRPRRHRASPASRPTTRRAWTFLEGMGEDNLDEFGAGARRRGAAASLPGRAARSGVLEHHRRPDRGGAGDPHLRRSTGRPSPGTSPTSWPRSSVRPSSSVSTAGSTTTSRSPVPGASTST